MVKSKAKSPSVWDGGGCTETAWGGLNATCIQSATSRFGFICLSTENGSMVAQIFGQSECMQYVKIIRVNAMINVKGGKALLASRGF